KIGAEFALINSENRLSLGDVNWQMVENWIKEGKKDNPTTNFEYFRRIPEKIIEKYSRIYTEITQQIPVGELDHKGEVITPKYLRNREEEWKEFGIENLTLISIESDEKISGLTEMSFDPTEEEILTQGLTGVRKNYRERGLGKYLKAALLIEMKNKYPKSKIVSTTNAETNAQMRSINERMGFKFYKERVVAQIETKKLKEFLLRKNQRH
ncbi:MAG: GNAT family N-acetyltransferase, partial [Candidatus Hodarchaeales archaeon]